MKKITAFGVIILCTASSFAQKGLTLSFNGGASSPIGNFHKADYANPTSGFAATGFNANINGIYHLNKMWGIGLYAGYSEFGHKDLTSLSDGYKEDSGTDSTTLTTNGNSRVFSVLIGPEYSVPISKKLSFNLRAQGGYSSASLMGFTIYFEDYTDNALTQNTAKKGGFGFQAGLGFCYKVNSRVGINLNADYFMVKPKFDIRYENFNVNAGRRLDGYNESIQTINTNLGISFRF